MGSCALKVGDIVEIVGSAATSSEARYLIGRQGVVTWVGIAEGYWRKHPGEQVVRLAPTEVARNGWYRRSLRKIDPPDWEAARERVAASAE